MDDKDNKNTSQTAVDREVVEVLAENERLKTDNADLRTRLDEATKQLRAANDLIDNHTRGGLIAQIQAKSDYGVEFLSTRTADQLRDIIQHFDHVKTPKALMGIDTSGSAGAEKTSMGDVYGSWLKAS